MMTELDRMMVIIDDITRLEVDAVVNPAGRRLETPRGVEAAIHAAAGERLSEACRLVGTCEPGSATSTPGFELPARSIIHTVGPIWNGGRNDEEALLRACYQRSLEIASELKCASVAFPCISTGEYGYPRHDASRIAIEVMSNFLAGNEHPRHVIICCGNPKDGEIYRRALRAARSGDRG
jgi:O-acetyl-ADP-ribose deacetylase (regulator of RNase III)